MNIFLTISWHVRPAIIEFSIPWWIFGIITFIILISFFIHRDSVKKNKDNSISLRSLFFIYFFFVLLFLWITLRIKTHGGVWEGGLRWYSIFFVSGFILGWFIFKWFFQREEINKNLMDPLLYTLLICTIVGARLGHCLFYQPDYYLGSWNGFLEIFMPWKGGLASHGGAIALILGIWWFAKHYGSKNHFDFVWLLDRLAIAVAFAAALIRLGNLFNSEIYGNVTNLPWGFIFEINGETEPKHPTQIYEGLIYLLLGIVLILLYKYKLEKLYRGFFVSVFLIVCFGSRFFIEFIKEPQVEFEESMALNMGQLLSIPFILLGFAFLIWSFTKKMPARAITPTSRKQKVF